MTKDEAPPPGNGLPLRAVAKDLETGNSAGARMDAFAGMTNHDVNRIRQEAQDNAAADAEKKELADLKNVAEGLIYTTRRASMSTPRRSRSTASLSEHCLTPAMIRTRPVRRATAIESWDYSRSWNG